eukprot:Plantae.Rhodophyta-Purpureofilum_apyrenoidigerum.ctg10502.p1 GENE.Plantae.Rhodophyta-Purpureofilum_apyrenoidigerum.ctg10502~~Plantae.Rhodophyta-Purpureofilum_apyrenoidigerum.ctg10502.p1  ORF type:complete len:426 (+),score=72.23 Plantae.Rhodophyta-Purpureofilum_apyrenoidigerum.ctg10502:147-1424(+)
MDERGMIRSSEGFFDPGDLVETSEEILEAKPSMEKPYEGEIAHMQKELTFRAKLYQTLTDPAASLTAALYSIFISVCIVISIVVLILESYYELRLDEGFARRLLITDGVVSVIFTIDYVLRLILSPHKFYFLINVMNIFDLLSFIPFYVEIGTEEATLIGVLRVFRVIRTVRLLEIGRYSSTFSGFSMAIRQASASIVMVFVIVIVLVVLFGTLMYYVETSFCTLDPDDLTWKYDIRGFEGEPTYFQNVPASMWWAIVTVTTVGYGDALPISAAGRVIAVLSMLCAIVVVAFPVTILGAAFSDSYDALSADVRKTKVTFRDLANKALHGCLKSKDEENKRLQANMREIAEQRQKDSDSKALQVYKKSVDEDPANWIKEWNSINTELKNEAHEAKLRIGRLEHLRDRLMILREVLQDKSAPVCNPL